MDQSASEQRALAVFVKLLRASDAVATVVHREILAARLSVSQFGVLEALYHLGPLYQKEIADKVLKSSGNMTLVINNLIKRGFVERVISGGDKRFKIFALTRQGSELIETLFPAHMKRIQERISVLDEKEQEELARLCKKLGTAQ
ncbi:MAG: MarR family transcriptional regulator [Desulfobulbaceae bacterium]|nr:MAG: MarR family transcriptional regulator [Desulfobulbaceae bacterium]